MPVAPRYTWNQSDTSVTVIVHMPGINKHTLHHFVQITPIYFCLNISPYLVQIDFAHKIDPQHVKVVIMSKKETKFVFPKQETNQEWGNLMSDKAKHIKLKERVQSLEDLWEQQRLQREKRKTDKSKRMKAAQQRQWDEHKYLKHVISRLEKQEKQKTQSDLKQWVDSKDNQDDQKSLSKAHQVKNAEGNEPGIRKAEPVELGFTNWNYITPARQDSQPPEFARKTKTDIKADKADTELK